MRRLRARLTRFSELFRGKRSERELAEELDNHLQLHIEDSLRAGMSAEEARRQALIKLGGSNSIRSARSEFLVGTLPSRS
jgi:macrolide transport system ATP-binding/permease protein